MKNSSGRRQETIAARIEKAHAESPTRTFGVRLLFGIRRIRTSAQGESSRPGAAPPARMKGRRKVRPARRMKKKPRCLDVNYPLICPPLQLPLQSIQRMEGTDTVWMRYTK